MLCYCSTYEQNFAVIHIFCFVQSYCTFEFIFFQFCNQNILINCINHQENVISCLNIFAPHNKYSSNVYFHVNYIVYTTDIICLFWIDVWLQIFLSVLQFIHQYYLLGFRMCYTSQREWFVLVFICKYFLLGLKVCCTSQTMLMDNQTTSHFSYCSCIYL